VTSSALTPSGLSIQPLPVQDGGQPMPHTDGQGGQGISTLETSLDRLRSPYALGNLETFLPRQKMSLQLFSWDVTKLGVHAA
jgi:hypothetical protein